MDRTNYFDKRSKSEFLEQCLEGSMVPEVTIFNTAWLIEKDLSEFYEKMAGQTTGKGERLLPFCPNGKGNTRNSSGNTGTSFPRFTPKWPGAGKDSRWRWRGVALSRTEL